MKNILKLVLITQNCMEKLKYYPDFNTLQIIDVVDLRLKGKTGQNLVYTSEGEVEPPSSLKSAAPAVIIQTQPLDSEQLEPMGCKYLRITTITAAVDALFNFKEF